MDYDEDEFNDDDYDDEEEDVEEEEENYDEMDENELADILQETNEFQIPHKTGAQANASEDPQENEHEIVFEEAANADEDVQVCLLYTSDAADE